jgi:hypothetical protein
MRLSVRTADGWECVCGNADRDQEAGFPDAGFTPCTSQGEPTVPCTRRWRGLWLCKGCGRIIYTTEQKSEVVGFALQNRLLAILECKLKYPTQQHYYKTTRCNPTRISGRRS